MAGRVKRVRGRAGAYPRCAGRWTLRALIAVIACSACHAQSQEKIRFDLSGLDESGLQGRGDGRRSLSYEFCIPSESPDYLDTVLSINPGLQCSIRSPGRIACRDTELLCVGDTHEQGVPALHGLAALEFIVEIREAHFE